MGQAPQTIWRSLRALSEAAHVALGGDTEHAPEECGIYPVDGVSQQEHKLGVALPVECSHEHRKLDVPVGQVGLGCDLGGDEERPRRWRCSQHKSGMDWSD